MAEAPESSGVVASGPPDFPDARFALAAERTLLAYQRTTIALIVAAVGIAHFLDHGPLLLLLCLLLVGSGGIAAVGGHLRYRQANRAIEAGERMPSSPIPLLLTVTLTSAVIVSVVMVIEKAG